MEGENKVVLLDLWSSPYAMRARIALAEKKVEYECKQENLADKSPLLLQMNPVHKRVPVLIHNGKPICESLNIVHYIDEVWTGSSPLLPTDPYLKSQALFWGDFVETKLYDNGRLAMAKPEEVATIAREFIENLKIIEGELKDDKFFGGDAFGYVDVALVPLARWFYALGKCGNFSVEAVCPKLIKWAAKCMERPSVSSSLPDPDRLYDYLCDIRKKHGLD